MESVAENASDGRFFGKNRNRYGGALGIGRAAALAFARAGADVAVGDIDIQAGEQAIAKINGRGRRATFIEADMVKSADCWQLLDPEK